MWNRLLELELKFNNGMTFFPQSQNDKREINEKSKALKKQKKPHKYINQFPPSPNIIKLYKHLNNTWDIQVKIQVKHYIDRL